MTDKTDLIREIHEYVTTHGGENTATHLLVQAASAIQTQAAELEAVSAGGVQALSAAPEAIAKLRHLYQNMVNGAVRDTASAKRIAEGLLAPAIEALERATPPAEQQATKETSGGFHVWRDISTAPKDGSRFVATGHNYGLYGEVRHTCVAQWFLGCWMEASDWNETSELKYLTHWMPLPSPPDDVAAPAEQQAAPKAAPTRTALPEGWTDCTIEFGNDGPEVVAYGPKRMMTRLAKWLGKYFAQVIADAATKAAPQQEAQEPVATLHCNDIGYVWARATEVGTRMRFEQPINLYTAPLPAPDCHHRPPCDECAALAAQGGSK